MNTLEKIERIIEDYTIKTISDSNMLAPHSSEIQDLVDTANEVEELEEQLEKAKDELYDREAKYSDLVERLEDFEDYYPNLDDEINAIDPTKYDEIVLLLERVMIAVKGEE